MNVAFHLSLPCLHIDATYKFYTQILKATVGRRAQNWLDVNLYGHQITFSKSGAFNFQYPKYSFDKHVLPSFHFGVILDKETWSNLYKELKAEEFLYIDKSSFLNGKKGAHQSFFVQDPNGYVIEFKCFKNPASIFES